MSHIARTLLRRNISTMLHTTRTLIPQQAPKYFPRFYSSTQDNKNPIGSILQTQGQDVVNTHKAVETAASVGASDVATTSSNNDTSILNSTAAKSKDVELGDLSGTGLQAHQFSSLIKDESAVALLSQDSMIVTRELEWGTILVGFEQANKYTIKNQEGEIIGLLAEQDSLGKGIMRNVTTTHRSFSASIMDPNGKVLLKIQRPFYFISSSMTISNADDEVIGEVHQRWHLLRRKYDLYIGKKQAFHIDAPTLSWDFDMQRENGEVIATVSKDFTGFMRTILTDANQYAIRLGQGIQSTGALGSENHAGDMTLDERALAIACAVAVDFDYFSRSSGNHGFLSFLPIPLPIPAPTPGTSDIPAGTGSDAGTVGAGGVPTWYEQSANETGTAQQTTGSQYGEDEEAVGEDVEEPFHDEFNPDNQQGDDHGEEYYGDEGEQEEGGGILGTVWKMFTDDD